MTDPDVFLYLYAHEASTGATDIINMPKNRTRYQPGCPGNMSPKLGETHERLALRFSDPVTNSLGVVAGRDDKVDLHLSNDISFSQNHFVISFNDRNLPTVTGVGSRRGINVLYTGDEEEELRCEFPFPLQGPRTLKKKFCVLYLNKNTQFRVVVPQNIKSEDYINKVADFRVRMSEYGEVSDALALFDIKSRIETEHASGVNTVPATSDLPLFKVELGKGGFGIVYYIWDPMTGEDYALKEPRNVRSYEPEIWSREIEVMNLVKHDHIVELISSRMNPYPQLRMEYLSEGNLEKQEGLSSSDLIQCLHQLLSALTYLHGRDPPIAHRDIKPENILVDSRGSSGIRVKFGDFGLAKADADLHSIVGTHGWLAPEIPLGCDTTANDTYTVAVDIWSLGLAIASLKCGLPNFSEEYKHDLKGWAKVVIAHVRKYERKGSKLLTFILDAMLVEEPSERKDAATCWEEALLLEEQSSTASTPTPSNYGVLTSSGQYTPTQSNCGTLTASGEGTPTQSNCGTLTASGEGTLTLSNCGPVTPSVQGTPKTTIHIGASAATVVSSEIPTESRGRKRSRLGEPSSRLLVQQPDTASTTEAADQQPSEQTDPDEGRASKRRKVGEGSRESGV